MILALGFFAACVVSGFDVMRLFHARTQNRHKGAPMLLLCNVQLTVGSALFTAQSACSGAAVYYPQAATVIDSTGTKDAPLSIVAIVCFGVGTIFLILAVLQVAFLYARRTRRAVREPRAVDADTRCMQVDRGRRQICLFWPARFDAHAGQAALAGRPSRPRVCHGS